jgi:hypothetical protein
MRAVGGICSKRRSRPTRGRRKVTPTSGAPLRGVTPYTRGMENNTLRVILAAALAPVIWGPVRWLVDRRAAKHAARDASRREQHLHRAYLLGRKLARWLRPANRRP